jgi:hypothetical protein
MKDHGQGMNFTDTLNRKWHLKVPYSIHVSLQIYQSNPKLLRIYLGELWDIGGDIPFKIKILNLMIYLFDDFLIIHKSKIGDILRKWKDKAQLFYLASENVTRNS